MHSLIFRAFCAQDAAPNDFIDVFAMDILYCPHVFNSIQIPAMTIFTQNACVLNQKFYMEDHGPTVSDHGRSCLTMSQQSVTMVDHGPTVSDHGSTVSDHG